MRRLQYIIAMSLTMVACSDYQEPNPSEEVGAIEFGAAAHSMELVAPTSRGVMETTESIASFGAFAFNFTSDEFDATSAGTATFMVNQKVSKGSDDTWSYAPTKNWGSNLQFYAYAPYAEDGSISATTLNGELVVDYVVPDNVALQHDLMLATPVAQSEGLVNMVFSHYLSAITFAVTGDGTRKVTQVRAAGFKNRGRLTQAVSGEAEWSNVASASDVIYEVAIIPDLTPSRTVQQLSADGATLLMIPQELTAAAYVEVESIAIDDASDKQTSKLTFSADPQVWEPNKRYQYTMHIITGASDFTGDIPTDVTVVDWVKNDDEIRLW